MYIENPINHPALRNLFRGLHHHLAVEAVLAGEVEVGVLVDDPREPRVGLTRVRQRCYISGDAANGETVRGWLMDEVFPRMKAEGYRVAGLNFWPPEWAGRIETAFAAGRVERIERQHYLLDLVRADLPRMTVPPGFELRIADKTLLDDERLIDLDDLREEMCSERASVDEFLQKSFGIGPGGAASARCKALSSWRRSGSHAIHTLRIACVHRNSRPRQPSSPSGHS